VMVMLEVMEECFPELMKSEVWKKKLGEMIPSYGKHLADDKVFSDKIRKVSNSILGI
jgi:malate dehydrogenase (quinone)